MSHLEVCCFAETSYTAVSAPGALVLSSGNAVVGSQVTNTGNSNVQIGTTVEDSDLQSISTCASCLYPNKHLLDTVSLTFDITPGATGAVSFQYVFGSEEYPEYAPRNGTPTGDDGGADCCLGILPLAGTCHNNVLNFADLRHQLLQLQLSYVFTAVAYC